MSFFYCMLLSLLWERIYQAYRQNLTNYPSFKLSVINDKIKNALVCIYTQREKGEFHESRVCETEEVPKNEIIFYFELTASPLSTQSSSNVCIPTAHGYILYMLNDLLWHLAGGNKQSSPSCPYTCPARRRFGGRKDKYLKKNHLEKIQNVDIIKDDIPVSVLKHRQVIRDRYLMCWHVKTNSDWNKFVG